MQSHDNADSQLIYTGRLIKDFRNALTILWISVVFIYFLKSLKSYIFCLTIIWRDDRIINQNLARKPLCNFWHFGYIGSCEDLKTYTPSFHNRTFLRHSGKYIAYRIRSLESNVRCLYKLILSSYSNSSKNIHPDALICFHESCCQ